jgi:hypothetical protein
MPRGRKKKVQVFNLESALDDSIVEQDEANDEEQVSDIIPIDSLGLYGMKTYKYGYELHKRNQYLKDERIEIYNPRTKESRFEDHKKGDYTEWQLSSYPFHGTVQNLIKRATQLMIKDGINYHKSIEKLPQILQETEERILSGFKGV